MGTTLTGTRISDTYDSLLKATDNGIITSSAKQITDGVGNNTPLYISTSRIGIGVSPTTTFQVSGNSKIGGDLTVTGNLLVEGTTTTVDTDTLSVKDPLIIVGNDNNTSDLVDLGFYGLYDTSGSQDLYAGLYRSASDAKFHLFKDLQEEPTTTVNTSGTGYAKADLVIGVLEATTGDFSGNVDIDGQLDVDDVISVEGSAFGRIEIGGASGGYIDLKAPNSDDYDLRIITSSGGNEVTTATGDLIFNTAETLALTIDTSQDATFEGNIIVSGTVDGRDIATDGAKLDGIESGATADQTAAEIKTAYESNSNTNAFTDADETKLDGIEASADVTDATNVLAAGAVMTTGNQSIGGVKTFSDQVTIPATPSASTDAASKGYVDAAVEGQDTLAEILAIGNTTGGTDIAITAGDKITNFTSTGIDDNASSETIYITSGGKIGIDEDTPLAKLTVNQDSLVDTEGIMVQSGNDAGNGGVAIFKSANLVGTVSALGSQGELSFMTGGGSERLRIDSSGNSTFAGNVRISKTDATLEINNSTASLTNADLYISVEDTGQADIRQYGAYPLAFWTNNVKRLTIDSSGNATFAGALNVNGNATLANYSGTSENYTILAQNDYGQMRAGIRSGVPYIGSISSLPLDIYTGNSSKIRIDTSGNVGIGEASPQRPLHVNGTEGVARFTSTASGNNGFEVGIGTSSQAFLWQSENAHIEFATNNVERMRIDSSGNVGIKNTSPSDFLSWQQQLVVGNGSSDAGITIYHGSGSGNQGAIVFADGNTGADRYRGSISYNGADEMKFFTSTSERMRIDNSGNVGINTTTPDSKLDVNAGITSITAGPAMRISKGASPVGLIRFDTLVIEGDDVPTIRFGESDGTVSTITSGDSNLRINTTGDIKFFTSGTATGEGHAGQGGTFAMVIATNQNVGIGTTSPQSNLDIKGSGNTAINSKGNLFVSSGGTATQVAETGGQISFGSWLNGDLSQPYPLAAIRGVAESSTTNNNRGALIFGTMDSNTTVQERMRIDSSGNVGIGTTSPAGILQVNNSGIAQFILGYNGASTNFLDGDTQYFRSGGGSTRMLLNGTGLGIGTTNPQRDLHVENASDHAIISAVSGTTRLAGLVLGDTADDDRGAIIYNNTSDYLYFQSNGAENMRLESNGDLHVEGDVVAFSTTVSDKRLKDDVKPLESSLDKVMNLKGVEYVWNNGSRKGQKDIGFIAQEVEEIIPEIVREKQVIFNEEEKYKTVDYEKITAVLVEAVKELKAEVEELKSNKCNCK